MCKPITDNIKEKVNRLYAYMKENREPISRETVCKLCGVATERQAREILAILGQRKPLISTSDCKGYRLAWDKNDVEEVRHTWAELSSRMEELEKRIKPLADFLDNNK